MNKLTEDKLNNGVVKNVSQALEGNQKAAHLGGIDLSFDPSKTFFNGFYQGKNVIKLHKGTFNDISLKDMVVPLKIMYDQGIKNKNISVSVDPKVPTQPDGPEQIKVYYPR